MGTTTLTSGPPSPRRFGLAPTAGLLAGLQTDYYVDTDAGAGGNGKTPGTAWNGLQTAITALVAEEPDLSVRGPITINCVGAAADSAADLTGFTNPSATNFITLAGELATTATWDTSRYRIDDSEVLAALDIGVQYTRVFDIQARNERTSTAGAFMGIWATANNVIVDRCLGIAVYNNVSNSDNTCSGRGIRFNNGTTGGIVANSIGLNFTVNTGKALEQYGINNGPSGLTMYNCLCNGSTGQTQSVGLATGQNYAVAKNSIALFDGGSSSLNIGFSNTAYYLAGTTHNATKDASAPGASPRINQTFRFVNEAGDDYRLLFDDTAALNLGTDLSADGTYPFTWDFFGTTRSGWSIGPFEVGVGPSSNVRVTAIRDQTRTARAFSSGFNFWGFR